MRQTLHVFSGIFSSLEDACKYSEAQWERPAPDDSWSDEANSAWEARNPKWQLEDDLGVYLDSDFIETIFGSKKNEYLLTQLVNDDDKNLLLEIIPPGADTLVLIMSKALGGFPATLRSTPALRYHGEFLWNCE